MAEEFELLKRVMSAKNLKWQGGEMYLVSAILRAVGEAGVGGAVAGSGLGLGYWGRAKTPGVVFGLQRKVVSVTVSSLCAPKTYRWTGEHLGLGCAI